MSDSNYLPIGLAGVSLLLITAAPQAIAQAQTVAAPVFPLISIHGSAAPPRPDLTRPVLSLGYPSEWVRMSDYPAADVAARTRGKVAVRVAVDASDRITGCRTISATGFSAMEALACSLIRERGRFVHALSSRGAPVADEIELSFEFRVYDKPPAPYPPAPPPPPPEGYPYQPGLRLSVPPDFARYAPAGKPSGEVAIALDIYPSIPERRSCRVIHASGDAALDKASCDAALTGQYARLPDAPGYSGGVQMLVRWNKGKARFELPRRVRATAAVFKDGPGAWRLALPPEAFARTGSYAMFAVARTTFHTDGRLDCIISRSSGMDATDQQICSHLRGLKFAPMVDLYGRKLSYSWSYTYYPTR